MRALTKRSFHEDARQGLWPGMTGLRSLVTALAVALCLGAPPVRAQPADEQGYRLGPEDKVRLKVFEWRPSQDVIFEWKALNDEFTVSADGTLSIPLAGQVAVAGLTPAAVASLVGSRLRERLGLSAPPDTSIDVVQYRPFFVAGDVMRPGPFPFKPGLSVLEAVAVAGGLTRMADLGVMRMNRDVITQEGELNQLGREYQTLLIRRARLQAEVRGDETFQVPSVIPKDRREPFVATMVEAETLILQARARALSTQAETLKSLQIFLQKEGESLDKQITTIDTQTALINKELSGVATLVEKGFAAAPRELALERSVAQVQGDRFSMESNKLRVQEEMSKAQLALIELRNTRATEASIELRDTQARLDEIADKTTVGKKLLFEAKVTAPRLVADYVHNSVAAARYAIVRESDGAPVSIDVDENARLQPGDTVKVLLPLPPTDERQGGRALALDQPADPSSDASDR